MGPTPHPATTSRPDRTGREQQRVSPESSGTAEPGRTENAAPSGMAARMHRTESASPPGAVVRGDGTQSAAPSRTAARERRTDSVPPSGGPGSPRGASATGRAVPRHTGTAPPTLESP